MRRHLRSAPDTEAFGRGLAAARPAGAHELAVLYLSGELGSGKTTFARGFLSGAGVREPVRSPTYTLLEPYSAGELTLVHIDLYRLRVASEIESLGLREYARAGHVWLIEWPERGAGHLPPADLSCGFSARADGHELELQAHSGAARQWLAALPQKLLENPKATP